MLRPTVCRPVCLGIKHPFGAYGQIFIIAWQLRVWWFGAPSLTRGRVCRLQLQLALVSAVIFGSEFHRTRGHILLSQIRYFFFRRLLRLAGSRWRYSTLSLSLMLRPTVSRPVCLGIKHPSGAYDQFLFLSVAGWLMWGALSDERTDGSLVYNSYWSSPAQSFSSPSPVGLATIFYCLRYETSLFVASYDSQGYGGGIQSRLHTRMNK
jgi:hypothetical protein